MNNPSVPHFPRAAGGCLALLLIVLTLLVGSGQAEATAVADQLIWVRQDDPVINVNNAPIRIDATEPRFEGSFTQYQVDETKIVMETAYVDHGYEWYHVTLTNDFDRPPLVLNPPLRYKIVADFAHSGTVSDGSPGARFWYSDMGQVIQPKEVLAYFPWDEKFDGTSRKEWMINPPAALHEGATFEITAGWWNCEPCNITWTYRAEPANAVEQLGVEVVQPVVKYQGEEVPPGETFFPETCSSLASRSTANTCGALIESTAAAEAYFACVTGGVNRILLILNRAEIGELKHELVLHVAVAKIAESCKYNARAAEQLELGLVLQQGGMGLNNVMNGQTIRVDTPLGTAAAAAPGSFLTAYNPTDEVATFRAYSAPLTLQPNAGAPLVLQPPHQVELTASGFGPVTALPHVLLPVVIR